MSNAKMMAAILAFNCRQRKTLALVGGFVGQRVGDLGGKIAGALAWPLRLDKEKGTFSFVGFQTEQNALGANTH